MIYIHAYAHTNFSGTGRSNAPEYPGDSEERGADGERHHRFSRHSSVRRLAPFAHSLRGGLRAGPPRWSKALLLASRRTFPRDRFVDPQISKLLGGSS